MMNKDKKDFTFSEKVKWLGKFLGWTPKETTLHPKEGFGSFKYEVEQDFNVLYTHKER